MVYKLLNEEGDYIDIQTGEPRNIVEAEIAFTPEGVNVGWTEFKCIEDAMIGFSVKRTNESLKEENLVGDKVNNIVDTSYEEVE